ncbi:aldehyde ferredoxin oxidoreductase family protein [Halomarina ordinaria]|uniref:Aldehyde ferredoxin oxidoreductase family protein n=1 Tax=Halomarina ordinaria TaxID=3033939 RepID=A0ABD5U5A7_9EURY|nr:aldehyde ferredoxin oxidoreductase family protein [Halomarina sp. PSRA2]
MSDLPPVYGGEILHVHLDTGETEREAIDPADARRFLGGNGFAAKQVYEHVPDDADAFDPENVLAFAVGPMNYTPFQSTSRGVVGFVSPMTGGFFDSTFGGTFPQAQKTTGFEVVVLHGVAEDLSYVHVDEEGARLEDASEFAGMDTYETCAAVREAEGRGHETHVVAAGPAGENRVRFACLLHDGKLREGVAGRGGAGAVLGSKNVKAVAIREGEFTPEPADESGLRELANGQMGELMNETEMLQEYGTSGLVNPINEMGKLGTHNYQHEQADEADAEAVSGETLKSKYVTEDTTCANCAVRCGKHVSVQSEGLTEAKIPEFESLFATTTMQEVYDIKRVMKANDLCDRLGMDTISWGVTVAFARECNEQGLLDHHDSPHLDFGDADGLVELARQTAHREGFGDRLAEGSFRLAASLEDTESAERFLHGSKDLEFAAHSPRGLKGMSIGYATATRGGSHHDTRPTRQYGGEHDETTEGTPEFAARSQHYTALGDSLTQCRFVSEGGWGKEVNENYRDALSLATGWDLSVDDVEEIGERVYNLERLINVRRGVARRETDTLSHRVTHEPIPDGPSEGMYCPPEELDAMLTEYYDVRGWDDDGTPTEATLSRLDMGEFA